MILLSKTETLFARTHVSYPTPRIHVNEINECTSREYLTKYKVYNATNVNKKNNPRIKNIVSYLCFILFDIKGT